MWFLHFFALNMFSQRSSKAWNRAMRQSIIKVFDCWMCKFDFIPIAGFSEILQFGRCLGGFLDFAPLSSEYLF